MAEYEETRPAVAVPWDLNSAADIVFCIDMLGGDRTNRTPIHRSATISLIAWYMFLSANSDSPMGAFFNFIHEAYRED